MKINYTAFGKAIHAKREQERLSLADLEELTGISRGHLHKIEAGSVGDIGASHFVALLNWLGKEVSDFTPPKIVGLVVMSAGIGNRSYTLKRNDSGEISFLCSDGRLSSDLYYIASHTVTELKELHAFIGEGVRLAEVDSK